MTKKGVLEAKFIPLSKGTPLPELLALRSRAKAELAELQNEKKNLRVNLARCLLTLKKRAYKIGVKNGTRKERQKLIARALEVDLRSKIILANSQREGLETIKAVCLSAFGQSLDAQSDLLSSRLRSNFSKIAELGLSKVYVAPGFKERLRTTAQGIVQIEESADVSDGCAILETKSGTIEISVIEDLREAFTTLQGKLNEML